MPEDCRVATGLLSWAQHTLSSEEVYLHTLIMASRYCVQVGVENECSLPNAINLSFEVCFPISGIVDPALGASCRMP